MDRTTWERAHPEKSLLSRPSADQGPVLETVLESSNPIPLQPARPSPMESGSGIYKSQAMPKTYPRPLHQEGGRVNSALQELPLPTRGL